jgi:hypothetical protein
VWIHNSIFAFGHHGEFGSDSPVMELEISEEDQTKWLTVKGIQCQFET